MKLDRKKAEEHINKFIESKVPHHLWPAFDTIITGMKAGFYEGIKYQQNINSKTAIRDNTKIS